MEEAEAARPVPYNERVYYPGTLAMIEKEADQQRVIGAGLRLYFGTHGRKDPAGDMQADLIRHIFRTAYDVPSTKRLRLHTSSDILTPGC